MLFQYPKEYKDNLLKYQQQVNLDNKNRQEETKRIQKNQDREYIQNLNKQLKEEADQKEMERMMRIKNNMNEYNKLYNSKPEPKVNRSRINNDIKINDYGVNIIQTPIVDSQQGMSKFKKEYNLNMQCSATPKKSIMKNIVEMVPPKGREVFDEKYESRLHRVNKKRMYKDFLDNQIEQKSPNISQGKFEGNNCK